MMAKKAAVLTGEAQREWDGDAGEPAWALKPHETVCNTCWIVKPCDC